MPDPSQQQPRARKKDEVSLMAEALFLAGEKVLPGNYKQVGYDRIVTISEEGFLPASGDGRIAVYQRVKDAVS